MTPRVATVSQLSGLPASGAPTPLQPGDRVDGTYRVDRLLGEGSSGAVYLVHHDGLRGARFALKVLHHTAGRADALAREGRLASEIVSAHVVKVAALGRLPDGGHYLVMEYVEGPTLDALLDNRDLTTEAAAEVVRQLCLALEAAHARGLVHGDVSLRNVFATERPDGGLHVQLGDFGLARRLQREGFATVSAEQRVGLGTPRFASPEALSGDAIDERSDVFSVGVILYRLLVGRLPFDGASLREVVSATVRGDVAPVASTRPALRAFDPVVVGCLAADPAARFPSIRELRDALDAALRAGPSPAQRPRAVTSTARLRRAAIALAALVALTGAAWAALERWRSHARIPFRAALRCPDATLSHVRGGDPSLARAVAQGVCARLGAALDLDWRGGDNPTVVSAELARTEDGAYLLTLTAHGRVVEARGATPIDAAKAGAQHLLARADVPPMSPEEVRRWGARDATTAAAVRAFSRRRTSLLLAEYEAEPRAALARDPGLPLAHLLLVDVDRDPARRREAAAAALASAHRLPTARADALRAMVEIHTGDGDRDDALERLRHAYNAAPDDVDIAVLYASALVTTGRREAAFGVAERVHARFPGRAALALHRLGHLPERMPGEIARMQSPLGEVLPETRASSTNVCALVDQGRLDEAEEALAFGRRLGLRREDLAMPEAVVALAVGDPARIDRVTSIQQGMTQTWSFVTGARLRVAGLLHRGRVADADAALADFIAGRAAAGDLADVVRHTAQRMLITRLVGAPFDPAIVASLERALPRARLSDETYLAARRELALTRSADVARLDLAALDQEVAQRAGSDAIRRAGLSLLLIPLVAAVQGDQAAADRWRANAPAWYAHRTLAAYSAARALEAVADHEGAESAYSLAASPYELYERPFEAVAARVRLVDLLMARGASQRAHALQSDVDRLWREADEGLAARIRHAGRSPPAPR